MHVRRARERDNNSVCIALVFDHMLFTIGIIRSLYVEGVQLYARSVGHSGNRRIRIAAVTNGNQRFTCYRQNDLAAVAETPTMLPVVPTAARHINSLVVLYIEVRLRQVVDETGGVGHHLDRRSLGVQRHILLNSSTFGHFYSRALRGVKPAAESASCGNGNSVSANAVRQLAITFYGVFAQQRPTIGVEIAHVAQRNQVARLGDNVRAVLCAVDSQRSRSLAVIYIGHVMVVISTIVAACRLYVQGCQQSLTVIDGTRSLCVLASAYLETNRTVHNHLENWAYIAMLTAVIRGSVHQCHACRQVLYRRLLTQVEGEVLERTRYLLTVRYTIQVDVGKGDVLTRIDLRQIKTDSYFATTCIGGNSQYVVQGSGACVTVVVTQDGIFVNQSRSALHAIQNVTPTDRSVIRALFDQTQRHACRSERDAFLHFHLVLNHVAHYTTRLGGRSVHVRSHHHAAVGGIVVTRARGQIRPDTQVRLLKRTGYVVRNRCVLFITNCPCKRTANVVVSILCAQRHQRSQRQT